MSHIVRFASRHCDFGSGLTLHGFLKSVMVEVGSPSKVKKLKIQTVLPLSWHATHHAPSSVRVLLFRKTRCFTRRTPLQTTGRPVAVVVFRPVTRAQAPLTAATVIAPTVFAVRPSWLLPLQNKITPVWGSKRAIVCYRGGASFGFFTTPRFEPKARYEVRGPFRY